MGKVNQEPDVAFVEVSHLVKSSGSQYSSPGFDGRFMVYCQGLKLFIPEDANHIYLATGATDFRKQISGFVAIVSMQFKLDPFQDTYVFIFCNKKRDSIKVLRYNKTAFFLPQKSY